MRSAPYRSVASPAASNLMAMRLRRAGKRQRAVIGPRRSAPERGTLARKNSQDAPARSWVNLRVRPDTRTSTGL
jgi:hypothetical protein